MFKRVQKHLQDNFVLIREVWIEISNQFLSRLRSFEDLVKKAYHTETLSFSSQDAEKLLAVWTATLPPVDADDEMR